MILPVSPFQSARLSNGAMSLVLPPPLPSFSTPTTTGFPIAGLRRVLSRRRVEVAGGVRFDGPVVLTSDVEDSEVVFEHCVTQTLPPALTLQEGLQKIKDAVQMLKAAPPRCSTGFLRFQVAVPPSPKALSWFCCQPESSGVFPLIFLSKNMDNPTCKSLHVNGSRGVFGIGTAVSFAHSSLGKQSLIKRYVSTDSTHIVAYGFMDINLDNDSVSLSYGDDSFCFFIPQIELDELESVSILIVTLAWDDFFLSTFEEALHSLEVSLNQVIYHIWSTTDTWKSKCIRAALGKLNLVEDRSIPRVYMKTIASGGRESMGDIMELKESPSSSQFCVRLSATLAVSNNMLDHANELLYSLNESANINAVWASLIIEECSRLGLTYFCVAPGSRSSPLAVAASTHELITCISCFDERSLAFHAVGFARGAHIPAVVITSSGTAVSNLLPAFNW